MSQFTERSPREGEVRKSITFRILPRLRRRLKAQARQQNSSLSRVINNILEKELD